MATAFNKTYTLKNLFRLFLMCAFPVHLWSIFMALQDVGWIAERSIVIDAFSYTAYDLLFALAESLVVFLIVLILSPLGLKHWQGKMLVSAMTCLYFTTALWKMAMQGYFYFAEKITYLDRVIVNKLTFGNPLVSQWGIMIALLLLVITSVVLPIYLLDHYKWFANGIAEMIDRLSTLTIIYLVIDLFGMVLIFIRNVYTDVFWEYIFKLL